MIRYLRPCIKYFAFAGFFSLFINTLYMVFPLYMLAVYTRVLDSFSFSTLYAITAMALTALLVLSCLDLVRSRLLIRAGLMLDKLLSRRVVRKMLKDLSRLDGMHYRKGLQDINTLRNYLGGNAIFAFFDIPWIFVYLWVIYLVHPVLGMTATAGAFITLFLGILQNTLTQKHADMVEQYKNHGKQWVMTCFNTAGELQSMGMVHDSVTGFNRVNDTELVFQDKVNRRSQLITAMSTSFGVLMQVVIFGVGAWLVLTNEANPGVIIAASIIMGRALAPIGMGVNALKQTSSARSAYGNLKQLLQDSGHKDSESLEFFEGDLRVDNVRLDINGATVLDGIDFHLEPGQIMGLVGPNGAGKTSLCRLILGMWSPTQGTVLLDGHDATALDNETLGRFVGYLPQQVELFSGTVSENIARMGQVDAEKVVSAARQAGTHEIILSFARGYDTQIGVSGRNLSGGQRQRVGLARAMFGSPRLVILDEPNSNLDEAGEAALMEALGRLKQMGVTTIMITHKPELLQTVDRVLILQNGKMAGFGGKGEMFGKMMENSACKKG